MKKIIIITSFLFIIISSSCTKDYSCTCTTKLSQGNLIPYQTATVEKVKKHTSKTKATKVCRNTAKQMQANTRLLFDQSTTVETSCSLQENS